METLQALYDSEINFIISCFWDGGFAIKLGDELNGFKVEETVYGSEHAINRLCELAVEHYPRSKFAEKLAE